ncbi:MAG: IS4 family transposase [Deltaproteobacteria bacterium]|nr:IS4 family transposase [Deltaproteobacteria bacterium]
MGALLEADGDVPDTDGDVGSGVDEVTEDVPRLGRRVGRADAPPGRGRHRRADQHAWTSAQRILVDPALVIFLQAGPISVDRRTEDADGRRISSLRTMPCCSYRGVGARRLTAHARFVIGPRERVVASLDWTEYGDAGQHRIALNLVTRHGRATPLLWHTVTDAELTGRRNEHEDELLRRFAQVRPTTLRDVIILADRGFGDVALYELLHHELGFHFIIRFRGCIFVRDEHGVTARARDWVPAGGRMRLLRNASVTHRRYPLASVVAVHQRRMAEPWLLASSLAWTGPQLVEVYGRRFTCEENFRDEKDPRFGLGTNEVNLSTAARRDRLMLLVALAVALLTLLGAAGEGLGLDRQLRANTAKRRTHSLFRQGRDYLRGALGKMRDVVARIRGTIRPLWSVRNCAIP